jgi:hypothetical protein
MTATLTIRTVEIGNGRKEYVVLEGTHELGRYPSRAAAEKRVHAVERAVAAQLEAAQSQLAAPQEEAV